MRGLAIVVPRWASTVVGVLHPFVEVQRGHAAAAPNLGLLLEEQGALAEAEAAYRRADQRGDATGAFNLVALAGECLVTSCWMVGIPPLEKMVIELHAGLTISTACTEQVKSRIDRIHCTGSNIARVVVPHRP